MLDAGVEPRLVPVGLGQIAVTRDPLERLCVYGLGSCVAVVLFDRRSIASAIAHVVQPHAPAAKTPDPGRYADTAVPALIQSLGVAPMGLGAAIAGGAAVLDTGQDVGQKNVDAVRQALSTAGIVVLSSHVGGTRGRTVIFDPTTHSLGVRQLEPPSLDL